jgi:hypothetical protein
VMNLLTSCCYSSLQLPVPVLHVELLDTMPKTGEHLLDLYFLRRVDICGLDVPIVS